MTTVPAAPTESSDLTLDTGGILPARFGDRDVDVIAMLTEVFGPLTSDSVAEYPISEGGFFLDEFEEIEYIAPFGRTVCWDNGVCTYFGAGSVDSLLFSGWQVDDFGDPDPDLATADGLTIGSDLASNDDIIDYDPLLSCFTVAYGTSNGVNVALRSDDGFFAVPNEAGDGLDVLEPDPTQVSVVWMEAGQVPIFRFADC